MKWKAGGRKDTGHDYDGPSFEKLEIMRGLYYCEKLSPLNWNGMHSMVVGWVGIYLSSVLQRVELSHCVGRH